MYSLIAKNITRFGLLFMLLYTGSIRAQTAVGAVRENNTVYLTDINGLPFPSIKADGINGSSWLCEDWNTGTVKFAFGKKADSILLKFNLAHNKLLFKRNEEPYEFVLPVLEFQFVYFDSGVLRTAHYKSGYPAVGKNNDLTFYEVLAEGPRLHLLQYNYRKLTETYVFNGPPAFHYEPYTQLYLYDTEVKEMYKIKNRKAAITSALPLLAEQVNRLCSDNKWGLKTTEELKLLALAVK